MLVLSRKSSWMSSGAAPCSSSTVLMACRVWAGEVFARCGVLV